MNNDWREIRPKKSINLYQNMTTYFQYGGYGVRSPPAAA